MASNLASRFGVALVAVPLLAVLVYFGQPVFLWGVITMVSFAALYEFYAMVLEDKTDRLVSLVFALAAVCIFYWLSPTPSRGYGHGLAIFVGVAPVAIYYLFWFGDQATVGKRFAHSVMGLFYIGIAAQFLTLLRRDFGDDGPHLVVMVLAIAWVGDSAAYFAGRLLGKRKLYPAVSPNKTIAGAVGGIAGAVGAAATVTFALIHPEGATLKFLAWYDVVIIGVFSAVLGQIGDLVESLIKRSAGVKDSGSILPGHGGMLDRIDAVLFIAPFVYLYLNVRIDLLS